MRSEEHKTQDAWALWLADRQAAATYGEGEQEWGRRIAPVGRCCSLEGFFMLYSRVLRPSKLGPQMSYYLFRGCGGNKPTWEAYPDGGHWGITFAPAFDRGQLDRVWEQLAFALLGEAFDTAHVVGGCVSVKKGTCALSVWIDSERVKFGVGKALRGVLNLGEDVCMEYKTHSQSIKDATGQGGEAYVLRSPPLDPTPQKDENIDHAVRYTKRLAGAEKLGYDESLLANWTAQQEEMKARCVLEDTEAWAAEEGLKGLARIGGLDISFAKDSAEDAAATLVVIEYPSMKVLHETTRMVKLTQPYIPGFLAFREVPLLAELVENVRRGSPGVAPQLLMLDGNGALHPRGFGAACQLGVVADLPCLGVAKTFLKADGIAMQTVKDKVKAGDLPHAGASFPLVGASGRTWGGALRTTAQSVNPVFVSAGHRVSLKTSLEVVQRTCKYRVPEAIRQADYLSREFLRKQGLL